MQTLPFRLEEEIIMAVLLPDARELSDDVLSALRVRAVRGCELGFTEADVAEYLNNDLKGQVNAAGLPDDKDELRSRMQRFMNKLRWLPQHVRSYFKHPCMLYAMAA